MKFSRRYSFFAFPFLVAAMVLASLAGSRSDRITKHYHVSHTFSAVEGPFSVIFTLALISAILLLFALRRKRWAIWTFLIGIACAFVATAALAIYIVLTPGKSPKFPTAELRARAQEIARLDQVLQNANLPEGLQYVAGDKLTVHENDDSTYAVEEGKVVQITVVFSKMKSLEGYWSVSDRRTDSSDSPLSVGKHDHHDDWGDNISGTSTTLKTDSFTPKLHAELQMSSEYVGTLYQGTVEGDITYPVETGGGKFDNDDESLSHSISVYAVTSQIAKTIEKETVAEKHKRDPLEKRVSWETRHKARGELWWMFPAALGFCGLFAYPLARSRRS